MCDLLLAAGEFVPLLVQQATESLFMLFHDSASEDEKLSQIAVELSSYVHCAQSEWSQDVDLAPVACWRACPSREELVLLLAAFLEIQGQRAFCAFIEELVAKVRDPALADEEILDIAPRIPRSPTQPIRVQDRVETLCPATPTREAPQRDVSEGGAQPGGGGGGLPSSGRGSSCKASKDRGAEGLDKVYARKIDLEQLRQELRDHVPDSHPEEKEARDTFVACAEVLAGGMGGTIIAVVSGNLTHTLRFHHLDDGHLTKVVNGVARNMHEQRAAFLQLLEAFSAHSASDRWEQNELEQLAENLPEAAESLGELEGNPKDGAFVISCRGNVMGAAGHLKYASERWQLQKCNGKMAGTRHASSLALAEWLGIQDCLGVVFVRSDDGGVHVFLPQGEDPPMVLHVDSLEPLTQQEMLAVFEATIMEKGQQMYKSRSAMIRQGKKGERVITYVNGRVTSDVVIEDETSMVVRAPTVDGEYYVLPKEKCDANWIQQDEESSEEDWQVKQLMARGFRRYRPKLVPKWVYEVTAEDMAGLKINCFVAAWGAQQTVRAGDFLAMPTPENKEVYLMPRDVLSSYSIITKAQTSPELAEFAAGSDSGAGGRIEVAPPLACAPLEAAYRRSSKEPLSQERMLELFKDRIIGNGTMMLKVAPGLIRPGKLHERVVTCVGGRVTSDVLIQDSTSMVVRAGTAHKELYVLSQEAFLANWQTPGKELDRKSPVKRLLRTQGFKKYLPAQNNLKYVYKVTSADRELINGSFKARWDAVQPVQDGDYLAMPGPKARATEIYLMPGGVVDSYIEVTEQEAASGQLPGGFGHVTPAQDADLSQQEMIALFKKRIIQRGRRMRKVRAGLIRPGKRGEQIVTCVHGRVISDVVIQDETSMVVRAPSIDQELYVLPRAKFEEMWMLPGSELESCSPRSSLLRDQGWKSYQPKSCRSRYVYEVTAADLEDVPTGKFFAPWGALQPLREGDYLAMPFPVELATEVYLIPPEVLIDFEEVARRNPNEDSAPATPDGGNEPAQPRSAAAKF